jgi:hypothetical protein
LFSRPSRTLTLRTRLSIERALEGIEQLVARPDPWGLLGGERGETTFRLDYVFSAPKNRQRYLVQGRIEDNGQWRVVRLELQAESAWIHPLMIAFIVLLLAFPVYAGDLSVGAAIAMVAGMLTFYAFVNLLYVPDLVRRRVGKLVAEAVKGSEPPTGEAGASE